jgi:hypothetical protein
MSNGGALDLDSYRLAKYAVSVPCYICEHPNTFDAELCRSCFAPMALAHQARCPKVKPRMVATIGSSGVGKTVYLGMLMDMISRHSDDLQVLARGAFSIDLQQKTMAALSQGEFPEKTPNEPDRWNWVHCQIRDNTSARPIELIVPDMAGEALLEEMDHPESYRVVRSFLTKCNGALVLIDAMKCYGGTADQDYFTMKLLSYLIELVDDPKENWQNRPLAVVFSKADQCDESFGDPEGYAQRHATGLWRHCKERFKKHRFFAASVVGTCAFRESPYDGRVQIPLRVEPRGVIEPFAWMVQQLRSLK